MQVEVLGQIEQNCSVICSQDMMGKGKVSRSGCRSIENGRRGVLNRGNRLYGGRWLAAGHFTNE
nr:Bm6195 [Brugia malayi]